MLTTIYPTQIGYQPTGVNGSVGVSSVTFGRTITGSYEGIGFGLDGRPDYLQVLQINLTDYDNPLVQKGTITMNVADLMSIVGGPSYYNLTLKEVTVCDEGVTKKMVILGSQLYT